jgi:hypothetical protein
MWQNHLNAPLLSKSLRGFQQYQEHNGAYFDLQTKQTNYLPEFR